MDHALGVEEKQGMALDLKVKRIKLHVAKSNDWRNKNDNEMITNKCKLSLNFQYRLLGVGII